MNKEKFNLGLKFTKDFIMESTGLNLTLIEQIELKKTLEFTANIYENSLKIYDESPESTIDFVKEAAYIFLNKNYGTQWRGIYDESKYDEGREMLEKQFGFDYYPKFFKKLQDEMHFP